MNLSQADSVCSSLQNVLNNLKKDFYLTDDSENEIVGFNPIDSWIVEIIYKNGDSSFVHCSNVSVHSKHF